jgi:hypothetical protein
MYWRTTGPWGAGTGANLTATEFDANNWQLVQMIAAKATAGVGIVAFNIVGNELWVTLTDHTLLGPYILPVATLVFVGTWQPSTQYYVNQIFTIGGSTYIVLVNHISALTFDAGANDGHGTNYYGLLLSNPGNALPTGGAVGMVLEKATTADFSAAWIWPTLAGLHDVLPSPGPVSGQLVYWNGSAFSYIDQSAIGARPALASLSDVLASPGPTSGQVVYWSGSKFTYKTPTTTFPYQTWATTSKTLALADAANLIDFSGGSAGTLTVPTNASVAFPVGTVIWLRQSGQFQSTVAAAGGVTLNMAAGRLAETRAIGSLTLLQKTATDTWEVTGDLAFDSAANVFAGTGTISLDATASDSDTYTWTPGASQTINNSGGASFGKRLTMVINTSGTSSFTLTFGSFFKSMGTLATGTVSGKVFVIQFIGDGTNFNEVSRTTAM